MADTLALSKLYTDVKARFILDANTAAFSFGWREPTKAINAGPGGANRVVFVPGDPSGAAGKIGPARNPGRSPRPIATKMELFTVYIWAYDVSAPENELKQYEANMFLYSQVSRAIYKAARGTFAEVSDSWIIGKTERRYGAERVLVYTLELEIPDTPWPTAPVPVTIGTTNRIALPSGDEVCCTT